MNIFVGNLSFDATEADLKELFSGFGKVASVKIVMRKEKNISRSRGFGFVDMPDEEQALAAIASLESKEFMGRILNISPARSKKGPQVIDRPGRYKGGRRSRNYMKRQLSAGVQPQTKPRPGRFDNPMRWRKKKSWPRPWQKNTGEHKPWEKAGGEARPWKKAGGEARPWKKAEGESKPWRKSEGGFKPWKRPAGDANPWHKSKRRTQKSGFKGRRNPAGRSSREKRGRA